MSRPGDHTPKFVSGDSGSEPLLTYLDTTLAPTTPAPSSVPPTTESPITPFPESTFLGSRVAASITYRSARRQLVVRCWAEQHDRRRATRALQAPLCTMDLISEGGVVVSAVGRFDAVDFRHVVFLLQHFHPEVNHAYLARVTLMTADGEPIGPRTFGVAVN